MVYRLFLFADRSFLELGRTSGLSYELLNILFYCIFVPGVWTLLLCLRQRRAGLAALAIAGIAAAAWTVARLPNTLHLEFYGRNLKQLYFWSSNVEDTYRIISVLLGILAPLAAALLIALGPRRFALPAFLTAIAALGSVLFSAWFRLLQ